MDREHPAGAVPDGELPSIDDIYGYEDSDENDEAAFDGVLKAQERIN
ncbi:hypothetical protein [Burkholderia ubonensis]|nr:hypothetical protein [Burkholderia ubonensis]